MRTIGCGTCRRGRVIEEGFDGRTARDCRECEGTGEIALTADEAAVLDRFLAGCRVALTCDVCGLPRAWHDDGACPHPALVPFPTTDAPRPAA